MKFSALVVQFLILRATFHRSARVETTFFPHFWDMTRMVLLSLYDEFRPLDAAGPIAVFEIASRFTAGAATKSCWPTKARGVRVRRRTSNFCRGLGRLRRDRHFDGRRRAGARKSIASPCDNSPLWRALQLIPPACSFELR